MLKYTKHKVVYEELRSIDYVLEEGVFAFRMARKYDYKDGEKKEYVYENVQFFTVGEGDNAKKTAWYKGEEYELEKLHILESKPDETHLQDEQYWVAHAKAFEKVEEELNKDIRDDKSNTK